MSLVKDNLYSRPLRKGGSDSGVVVRFLMVQKRHGKTVAGIADIVVVAGDIALQHGLKPRDGNIICPPRKCPSPEAYPALRRRGRNPQR